MIIHHGMDPSYSVLCQFSEVCHGKKPSFNTQVTFLAKNIT